MSERKNIWKVSWKSQKIKSRIQFLDQRSNRDGSFATSREKDLAKISISELVKRAGVSRAAFYRNYDSKEEILESVFKRSVHNIMEQLSHYDVKTDLYLVWVHLFRAAKKEAKIIQLALDYHLERFSSKLVQEFFGKIPRKIKRRQQLPSFLLEFCHRIGFAQMDQGWHEGSSWKRLQIYACHFSKNRG